MHTTNPASILCERVLYDLLPADLREAATVLDEPCEHHMGTLQCYATRISVACYSDETDAAAMPRWVRADSLGTAIARTTAHLYGYEVAEGVRSAIVCYFGAAEVAA